MSLPDYAISSAALSVGRVTAGFSTRRGGDDVAGLARAAGFDLDRLFTLSQVHGSRVVRISHADDPAEMGTSQADALFTTDPGVVLAVKTADCVPVLLAHHGGDVVAAVHAGWRGLVADVLGAAVAALTELTGSPPSDLAASIGPAIGPCCYEVSWEVAEAVAGIAASRDVILERRPRPHIDLRGAALYRLQRAGIPLGQIELVGPCTRCAERLLHSYRREGPGAGRQLSFVYLNSRA